MNTDLEYKSGKFDWCIDIDFPISISNRCIFFYSLVGGFRANINKAMQFAMDNNIIVMFIYGSIKSETLINYLSKIEQKIVVVHYTNKVFDDVVKHEKINERVRERETKRGLLKSGTNEVVPKYFEELKKISGITDEQIKQHPENGRWVLIDARDEARKRLDEVENLTRIPQILRDIQKDTIVELYHNCDGQKVYEEEIHSDIISDYLERIISSVFCYGIEVSTSEQYAYKTIAMKKIVRSVLAGNTENKKLGINLDRDSPDCTISAVKLIDKIDEFIENHLRSDGYVHFNELYLELTKPPFGYIQNNWYTYVAAIALSKYKECYYIRSKSMELPYVPIEELLISIPATHRNTAGQQMLHEVFIHSPNKQYFEVLQMICELLKINPTDCGTLYMALTKFFAYFSNRNGCQAKKYSNNKLPLSLLNPVYSDLSKYLLSFIEVGVAYKKRNGVLHIIEEGYTKYPSFFNPEIINYLWHFFHDNFEYHKKVMINSDEMIIEKLIKKYGQEKADMMVARFYKFGTSEAVWLWDKDFAINMMEGRDSILCNAESVESSS